ncbi:hypothetical protein [Halomicrobium urmianum]|uniref:hypothetical protein n=1 Tax=Halomicrobium urmianum TaxID=1586233 RepID=UPI001CDA1801|nr:hypothetical protein [Halomicrobium urmianum]
MTRWLDRAEELLYEGEETVERVTVGGGGVVVTTHRVLAFTPDAEGSNYEAVERPNVAGVERRATGEDRLLGVAAKVVVVGLALTGAGLAIDMNSLIGDVSLSSGTGAVGMGGVLSTVQTMLDLLAHLDEVVTVVGALALLVGVVLLGAYARTRERVLVVEVAGDEDVTVSLSDGDGGSGGDGFVPDGYEDGTVDAAGSPGDGPGADPVDRLERAIRPGES